MGMVTLSSWALQGQGLCPEVGILRGFVFVCPRVPKGSAAVGPGHCLWLFSPCPLRAEVAFPASSMLWAACLVGRAASPQETLIIRDAK